MEENTQKKNTFRWWIAILITFIIAAAAYVGGSLIEKQKNSTNQSPNVDLSQAQEIPSTEPALFGMVADTDGDTLIVNEINMNNTLGTLGEGGVVSGTITIEGNLESDENSIIIPSFVDQENITVEVIVTNQTKVYQNSTTVGEGNIIQGDEAPDISELSEIISEEDIVMKIEPGDATQIGPTSFITVWGEKTGDRIIADFILYQKPLSFGDFELNQ
jgi:hypothetical protein